MISSQLSQRLENFDVIVGENAADFETSGLKTDSVIRICRLAFVNSAILLGSIGTINEDRLSLIRGTSRRILTGHWRRCLRHGDFGLADIRVIAQNVVA